MINIFICLDSNCLVPLNCLINSIIKCKNNYMFCILVDNEQTLNLVNKLSNDLGILINAQIFIPNQDYDSFYLGRMNYARFFFEDYFDVDDYIYIDTDMIVFGDIDEIWQIYMQNKNDKSYFASIMVDSIQSLIVVNPEYKTAYDKFQDRGFNAGIYITSAFLWKKNNVKENILKLLENSKGHFKFGTQPLLNIYFYKTIIELPTEWNVCSHTHSTDIPLITKIILDNKLRTVNVNILSNDYIANNNIKLIHYAGPGADKYWTIQNFNTYGFNGNGMFILNTFFKGPTKYLYSSKIDNNVIKYFYHYLNHGYKIKFTDKMSDINLENDLVYLSCE